jgi:serine/threonine-protein kinase HipA
MRLSPGTPLDIGLRGRRGAADLPAARLAMVDGLAQLEWSTEVVERALPISPLFYPPERGLHAARGRDFIGLHGFLTDSLPDAWGYLLMRRRLARLGVDIAGLSAMERLALVGESGRGGLVFAPVTTPGTEMEATDLDSLAEAACELLAGGETALGDALAALAGGSGGARPKIHVGFDANGRVSLGSGEVPPGYEAWMVKFRGTGDPVDIGPIEAAYADMARAAGLTTSAHRLIPARSGAPWFATRRFDRTPEGGRVHMVSLAGAIEAPSDRPSVGYDAFLRATLAITRNAEDVAETFRRMIFNILASNRDDHTRQHAYLMDSEGGWSLAPAYDLTHSAGPGGEHYLDVDGEGRRPTLGHVAALARRHGIDARRLETMVEQAASAIADWPTHAGNAGVTRGSLDEIGEAHRRVWREFNTG